MSYLTMGSKKLVGNNLRNINSWYYSIIGTRFAEKSQRAIDWKFVWKNLAILTKFCSLVENNHSFHNSCQGYSFAT